MSHSPPATAPAQAADLHRTIAELEHGVEAALHPGAQVCVSLRGRVVAELALGEARPGVGMTPDTITLWLSACKPVAAVAIGQLWERGLLDVNDAVARHVPEFAAHGKGHITIRHLLTHTGGIRGTASSWSLRPWEDVIAGICAANPEPRWNPEWRAGYDASAGWFLLGEIVRRVSGQPYCEYVRGHVFEPCGMENSWIGLPAAIAADTNRVALMWDTRTGGSADAMPANAPEGMAACLPGANGRGPARDLVRFYEMLLAGGVSNGRRIISPQTVAAMTARQRAGIFDHSMQHLVDWGFGLLLNPRQYGLDTAPYGYGPNASPRAYGHSGNQSSVGFADPAHGLAVAVITNGMPGEAPHQSRMKRVLAALYEDLGLTPAHAGAPTPPAG